MNLGGKKVFIGLSGGVDSAVSAALLQKAGADVTGVFIKGWYPAGMPCTWAADRRDAMRVAARLHIPFQTLDASVEYKHSVIDYLLSEYRAGRTPNPDVMCNREVKFGAFYRYAIRSGADAIAMGHYVSGEKDQRYFLWAVPQEVLQHTLFPLTGRTKPDVRKFARSFRLPVSEKKDSQGVCFLGAVSVEDFLKDAFGVAEGVARDTRGEVVGKHTGVLLHTIGERLSLVDTSVPGPWYVIAKDIARNELCVDRDVAQSATSRSGVIRFTNPVWHQSFETAAAALLRYRGTLVPGVVQDSAFKPTMPLAELPVPGQSIVFFNSSDELVGGGIIAE